MITFTCPRTKIILHVYEEGNIYKAVNNTLLTKHIDKDGYHYICLKLNGIRVNYKVHRLVCLHHPNPDNLPCVNHLDGDKQNNNSINVEWCSYSDNMKHAVKLGLCTNSSLKGENHNTSKYSFSKICEIRNKYKQSNISMRKLAKLYNCSVGYVSDIVNNKIRQEL